MAVALPPIYPLDFETANQGSGFQLMDIPEKGVGRSPRPPAKRTIRYVFFSEPVLIAASHIPPAFLQSASVFAEATSPDEDPRCAPRSDAGNALLISTL